MLFAFVLNACQLISPLSAAPSFSKTVSTNRSTSPFSDRTRRPVSTSNISCIPDARRCCSY
eukprot:20884-Eustigmatos_ZCMA.PRE.1